MTCPQCGDSHYLDSKNNQEGSSWLTIIKIKPEIMNDVLKHKSFDRDIQFEDFTIKNGPEEPIRSFFSHPAGTWIPLFMIVLWMFGISIILGVIALFCAIPIGNKITVKESIENDIEFNKKTHQFYIDLYRANPRPPLKPTNNLWKYWGLFIGWFLMSSYINKDKEFSIYFLQLIMLIGFPAYWLKYKEVSSLKYLIKLKAYNKTMEHWESIGMCTNCRCVYKAK